MSAPPRYGDGDPPFTSRRSALIGLLISLILSLSVGAPATEKAAALVLVKDSLTAPNQPATVEARLVSKGLFTALGLGGEPLELVINDEIVATGMTGGDGTARLSYTPKVQGVHLIRVRVGPSPRVAFAEGTAHVAVWERRSPIIAVEVAALMDESPVAPLPGTGLTIGTERKALPDAAEELAKLTQFHYRVIYIVSLPVGGNTFQIGDETRRWLSTQNFPTGYVLVLPPGDQALGATLDELHAAGWKTLKMGIGRTATFAEAFLQRRLEAVIVPEPVKGEVPRKAKVAKEWKEVRKKL